MKSELEVKWPAVLDLQLSFSARDVRRKARQLFLLLHTDKSNQLFEDQPARSCIKEAFLADAKAKDCAEDWLQQNPNREHEEELFSQSSSWASCWQHSNLEVARAICLQWSEKSTSKSSTSYIIRGAKVVLLGMNAKK